MSRVFLIGHTGSMNRGCEAIVRSTVKLLNCNDITEIYLISYDKVYDSRLGVDKICYYLSYKEFSTYSLTRIFRGGIKKIFKNPLPLEKARLKSLLDIVEKDDVVMTIGGDTFCYGKPYSLYAQHKLVKAKGAKTILWSCSIEDKFIDDDMIKDFNNYDYIMPRETLSYNTLIKHGISDDKLIKMSDSAFCLDTKEVEKYKNINNVVGINVSTIVSENDAAYRSAIYLINYIITKTDMNVLLIPHVYDINMYDDYVHKKIKKDINNNRIDIVSDFYSCEELKYIISKCRFFIGGRTHATIAAYSTGVPTLALGYSVKSRGIAIDLFNTECGYTIINDSVKSETELTDAFINIVKNEKRIRNILANKMPDYKKSGIEAAKKVKSILNTEAINHKVYFSNISCSGCGTCSVKCPKKCITMQNDQHGFKYPVIDMDKCIKCDICRNICPIKNKPKTNNIMSSYAVFSKNEEIRKQSSSGGVFSELANQIILNGGVVFGAGFDEEFNVVHMSVDNKNDLIKLQGSKYVQSDLGDSFKEVKEYLDNKKWVLFSGTSCQIAGLRKFLGREYENLITVDFICHGVPSPFAWKTYLQQLKNRYSSEIKNISFRNKDYGWKVFSLKVEFIGGFVFTQKLTENWYMKSFLTDTIIRDSCTSCAFKGFNGVSDITLADFWGIESIINEDEYRNDKGVSAVMIRTAKGQELFNKIQNIIVKQVSVDDILKSNKSLLRSVKKNEISERFYNEISEKNYDKIVKKYYGNNVFAKVRRFLLKIL